MQKGSIGVTTENIFPVIKKFLYSDHEIFLRELVSNAVDASTKLRALANFGEYTGEIGDLNVTVTVDPEANTTVSDRGIGMDADDIEKYINRIAFSGAEDFSTNTKDTAANIIGHFGLGFYPPSWWQRKSLSRPQLSRRRTGRAMGVRRLPELRMGEGSRKDRGTDIIPLHRRRQPRVPRPAARRHAPPQVCRFLPRTCHLRKEREWKDGKWVDTDRPLVINSTEPEWTKKATELTDSAYLNFYQQLYPPEAEEPMFDTPQRRLPPFHLTGILYFPQNSEQLRTSTATESSSTATRSSSTDSVEGVVPEFMQLMRGVIDSP